MDKVTDSFARLGPLFSTASESVTRGFFQTSQLVRERLGNAGEVTELPAEFRELEGRVERVRLVLEGLTRISQTYTRPHYDYFLPLQDSVVDFAARLTDNIERAAISAAEKANIQGYVIFHFRACRIFPSAHTHPFILLSTPCSSPHKQYHERHPSPHRASAYASTGSQKDDIAPSLPHALAKAAAESALVVGPQEPLGAALTRFATVLTKIGDSKLAMDSEIVTKFHTPLTNRLKLSVGDADKARKQVQNSRLHYDACKQRLKGTTTGPRVDALRADLEKAEDEFVNSVEEAMIKMKLVLEGLYSKLAISFFVLIDGSFNVNRDEQSI